MPLSPDSLAGLQSQFEADLPRLKRVADFRLRRFRGEAKDEAVAETLALCWHAYVRLIEGGRSLAVVRRFAQKTAEFSAKQVLCGRALTGSRSADVLSPICRHRRGYAIDPLPEKLPGGDDASPADQAALRVDFAAWLDTLRPRQRQVIEELASGLNTVEVGEQHGVTYGAISNMRQALRRRWEERFADGSM